MDTYIHNQFPIISDLEDPWRTHFGVIPEYSHVNDQRRPVLNCGLNDDGSPREHDDPYIETMLWRAPGVTAWVSGSFGCWGPQDQGTDGDRSLHVVVFTPEFPTDRQLADFFESLALDAHDGEGCMLDHALITRRDDSEIFALVTFYDGNPTVYELKG